ncbi:MAG TPA: BACON domain-containing protein [Blastocatellia bacterium]|nr:BACON domain-containing protein [Blastocatellia bacterium]HMV86461.1 BACON domain-containing protein [Blastocatellia bacterium]HMX25881.1 BACON domain-containing protein [Blastocatellia bacterium]HMY73457.1 BACON domain-containing protein [Blastocatellia bacterium]HMZ17103.1 BACON domain-containing protein [Blastocatellia bacterium]
MKKTHRQFAALRPQFGAARNPWFRLGVVFVLCVSALGIAARIKAEAVGQKFSLSNAGRTGASAAPSVCTYSLSPASQAVPAAGGAFSVNVITDPGCFWTSFSNSPWITVTGGTSGIGNGTVNYTVAQNATGAIRNGSLTIESKIFAVTQSDGTGGLQFYPLSRPIRLLDTRAGFSGCDAPQAPITGNTSRTQTARRTCDGLTIPLNAQAITGNITTVESGGGFLTLYPSDAAQPLVANSNFNPNEILNNVFTVGLGNADGAFKIYVTSTTHVVVDVTGYYAPPATGGLYFHPLPRPVRLLETRFGLTGCYGSGVPLPGNLETAQQARGVCEGVTIPTAAAAIVGNATTVNTAGIGSQFMTLFPADAARPLVANSNYSPGQVMNAPFTVGLSAGGSFKIFPTSQTDLVVDVLGYYSAEATDVNGAGLLFTPLPKPVRLLETRAGFSGCYAPGAPLPAESTRTQPARGACDGVTITANALGIVGNATVVNANGGYLTFWPSDAAQPTVATSNFTVGQIFNRHFTVGLGATGPNAGAFKIFPRFQTDLVIDVSGFFAP